MKWLGYPGSENTWESIEGLTKCHESIDDFEKAEAQIIIGTKNTNGIYAIKCRDKSIRLVDSNEVKKTWPRLLHNYLEERMQFTMENFTDTTESIESNVVFITSNPLVRILGKYKCASVESENVF